MSNVRLKPIDDSKNKKIVIISIILIILFVIILLFNPFMNLRDLFLKKREQAMNKTPDYESLKDLKLIGDNGKYNIPVVEGKVVSVSNNIVTVKAPIGNIVRSIDEGVITKVGVNNVNGKYVEISYGGINKRDFYIIYGNLDDVISGEVIPVQGGQKLGKIGKSGNITIEIMDENKNRVNPYEYMNFDVY